MCQRPLKTSPYRPSTGYDYLEARLFDFVAAELVANRKKLRLSSSMIHDLELDGDDAMDLFQAFQKEFRVDLGPLWRSWEQRQRKTDVNCRGYDYDDNLCPAILPTPSCLATVPQVPV